MYGYRTEQEKEDEVKGKYLSPELFGLPKEYGVHYCNTAQPGSRSAPGGGKSTQSERERRQDQTPRLARRAGSSTTITRQCVASLPQTAGGWQISVQAESHSLEVYDLTALHLELHVTRSHSPIVRAYGQANNPSTLRVTIALGVVFVKDHNRRVWAGVEANRSQMDHRFVPRLYLDVCDASAVDLDVVRADQQVKWLSSVAALHCLVRAWVNDNRHLHVCAIGIGAGSPSAMRGKPHPHSTCSTLWCVRD